MSLSLEPANKTSGRLTSPDLRLRPSTTLWGPLQLTLVNHREGAESGYKAGEDAYEEDGQGSGATGEEVLRGCMAAYLASPGYRPRLMTNTILVEWRALFVLGWTGRMLERSSLPHMEVSESVGEVYQGITGFATCRVQSVRNGGREQR